MKALEKIEPQQGLAKVPEVTLGFWLIKIAATTLGETGGDAVSMSMHLGYLVGTAIFAIAFLIAVGLQIRARTFSPILYWSTIIATTTTASTRPRPRKRRLASTKPAIESASK